MGLRLNLLSRAIIWLFLTIGVIAAVLFGLFRLQFSLPHDSIWRSNGDDRLAGIVRLIFFEMGHTAKEHWDDVLLRYGEAHDIQLAVFRPHGRQLAGKKLQLPAVVSNELAKRISPHAKHASPRFRKNAKPVEGQRASVLPDFQFPPGARFAVQAGEPSRYWVGLRVPLPYPDPNRPTPAVVLAVSDSITGGGLFMSSAPWVAIVLVVILLALALWFPFVRSVTQPLTRITRTTERIANGHFDTQLKHRSHDEIGRLSTAINHMSRQLAQQLDGQKRFLGDVAHELTSPLARIRLGLGILENKIEESNHDTLNDVVEDVAHMTALVHELLSFSRAELGSNKVRLQRTPLLPLVEEVIQRESTPTTALIKDIDEHLAVHVDRSLFTRALSNIVRNAIQYAGDCGPIQIVADREVGRVTIHVIDQGPGVTEGDLTQLFDPFFRPARSRANQSSGGAGLGLAIVRSCIAACGGEVTATNRNPCGLGIRIDLPAHL